MDLRGHKWKSCRNFVLTSIFLLGIIFLVSAIQITTFSDGISSGNLTFNGNQNHTLNISIYKNANVTSAVMNLSGYKLSSEDSIGENIIVNTIDVRDITNNNTFLWILGYADKKVYKYWMNGTYTSEFFSTTQFGGGSDQPLGVTQNGTFFWVADAFNIKVYKYWMNGTYTTESSDLSGGDNTAPYLITNNNTFIWIVDSADAEVYQYWMNMTYTNEHFDTAGSGNIVPRGITQNGTFFWIMNNSNSVYKHHMNGTYTSESFNLNSSNTNSFGITQNETFFWVTDSADREIYKYWMVRELSNPYISINNTQIWSHSGIFDSAFSPNQTDDFASTLNSALNNGVCDCTGCSLSGNNCTINFTFHSDTSGILEYSAIDINWGEYVNPLISITSPSSGENSSNDQQIINYTASDDNLQFCWYSNDTMSINTTLADCTTNITGIIWGEGQHNVTIWANDTSGNENSSSVTFNIITTYPTITIINPKAQNYANNDSVQLNYTSIDSLGISTCIYNVNYTNGTIAIANTTLAGCTNTTFALSGGDNDFVLKLYSNNSVGNMNLSSVTFGIRTTAPVVVLDAPSDNSYSNDADEIFFNFTATSGNGIDTCKLESNFTSSWGLNETFSSVTSDVQVSTTKNLADNYYSWNTWCNDSLGNSAYALNNLTTTIDTILPNTTITIANQSSFTSLSLSINYAISDINLDSCSFTLKDSNGNIHNYESNTSLLCSNSSRTISVLSYGTYTFRIWGTDKANNVNSSIITFTTSAPPTPGGGGGGSPTKTKAIAIVQPKNDTNYYNDLGRAIIYARFDERCKDMKRCFLNSLQKEELVENLSSQYVSMKLENIQYWIDQYNLQDLENVEVSLRDADSYHLVTASLTIISPGFQILSPTNFDRLVFLFADDVSQNVVLSKEVKSCEVVQGDIGFSCNARGGYATVSYELPPEFGNFTFKNVIATISYQSIDGDNSSQNVSFRLIRPSVYLVLSLLGLIIVGIFGYKNRVKIIKNFKKIKKISK